MKSPFMISRLPGAINSATNYTVGGHCLTTATPGNIIINLKTIDSQAK